MSEINDLIFGKAPLQNVVSIEIEGDEAIIYTEKAGVVSKREVPHKFWLLCNERLDLTWVAMKGDQHYKFGKQFTDRWKMRNEMDRYQGKDFYLSRNPVEGFMIKDGYSYYKGSDIQDISILSFDIETNGLVQNDDSRVFLISNTMRINGEVKRRLFSYEDYNNDGEMIEDWCNWVRKVDPSIMCGHNIYCFDLPYLNHVAKLHEKGLYLGRNESAVKFNPYESKFRVDGTRDLHYFKAQIYGRELADTMFLAYKYDIGRKYESYGLKQIIKAEKLEKTGRTFYEAGSIKDHYQNPVEWAKIKQYAEEDGDDALTLFDLMAPPFFYMSQMIPKPFQLMLESASGSQLNALMVRGYLQQKHSIPKADEAVDFEGALSNGFPGIYRNCLKFDVASLYPSIMLQYEIYSKEKDPNAHLIQFLKYLREERLKNKRLAKETGLEKYKHLDGSLKILLNSLYGFMGAANLSYNFPKGAAEVTRRGREILTKAMEWACGEIR